MPKPQRKAPRPASFFEAHKAEIIADYRTMGDSAMCAKWGLRGHWHRWRKKWGVMSNTELAVVIEQTKPETDAIETLEEALGVDDPSMEEAAAILKDQDATIQRLEGEVKELTESLERTEKQRRAWQAEYDKAAHQLKEAEKDRDGWKKLWAEEHERVRRLECPPILMNSETTPVPMSHLLQLLATIAEVVERD